MGVNRCFFPRHNKKNLMLAFFFFFKHYLVKISFKLNKFSQTCFIDLDSFSGSQGRKFYVIFTALLPAFICFYFILLLLLLLMQLY